MSLNGLLKIVGLKASINKGLKENIKAAFLNAIPVQRPLVKRLPNLDPYWLAGFITGGSSGCFFVNVFKATTNTGFAVSLVFKITQHSYDAELIKSFIPFFNSGLLIRRIWGALRSNKDYCDFLVTTLSDNYDKKIPFLKKYKVEGVKADDFADFCKIAEIVRAKGHLTPEGGLSGEILKLKDGMNSKRLI